MDVGTTIKEIRKRSGFTQAELGSACGYSLSYIKKIESGTREPSVAFIRTFCGVLNVSADYVLYGEHADAERAWEMLLSLPSKDQLWVLEQLFNEIWQEILRL